MYRLNCYSFGPLTFGTKKLCQASQSRNMSCLLIVPFLLCLYSDPECSEKAFVNIFNEPFKRRSLSVCVARLVRDVVRWCVVWRTGRAHNNSGLGVRPAAATMRAESRARGAAGAQSPRNRRAARRLHASIARPNPPPKHGLGHPP